jgi:hypothetical protein
LGKVGKWAGLEKKGTPEPSSLEMAPLKMTEKKDETSFSTSWADVRVAPVLANRTL